MKMSLILGVLYILVIGAVTVSMTVLLLMGRKEKYNIMYFRCQGMVIFWCVSQILILLSKTQWELSLAYMLGNIGVCFAGACWFGFAFTYGGKQLPDMLHVLPFMMSGIHYILVLTNGFHHLYYTEFSKERIEHGVFFVTNVMETYLFVIAGAVILYRSMDRNKNREFETELDERTAKILIIGAVLVPMIFNLFYLTGIIQASFDITPLGFGISGILVLFATIRYRFMEVNVAAFATVLSGLSDGVAIFDRRGKCTFCNKAFREVLPYTSPAVVMAKIGEMIHLEEHVYVDEKGRYFQIQFYQSTSVDAIGGRVENMKETELSDIKHGSPYAFLMIDISRYYELLQQTKELAITSEKLSLEKERNRIAQQVHDTIGHTLTMIQSYIRLAQISREKQQKEQVMEYLKDAEKMTSNGIRELRQSIHQLCREPENELVTYGVFQLADQMKEIPVEVTVRGTDSRQYSHLSTVVYDCVRESMTNTLKYSGAGKLDVVLHFKEKAVEVTIADDGRGCDKITYSNGLKGIRKRVEEAGGTVRFISQKGEGFLTSIQIPTGKNKERGTENEKNQSADCG